MIRKIFVIFWLFLLVFLFAICACNPRPDNELDETSGFIEELPGCDKENKGTQCVPPCNGIPIGPHGLCTVTCGNDNHCPLGPDYGEVCLDGLCGIVCDGTDESCPAGLSCIEILNTNVCGLPCGGYFPCNESDSTGVE